MLGSLQGAESRIFSDSGSLSLQVMTTQDGRTKEITTCVGRHWHTQVFGPDGKMVQEFESGIPTLTPEKPQNQD